MNRLSLSNLHVRPNLLSESNCQKEMMRCSIFELRDIKTRTDLVPDPLPAEKQQEWRESLFWGDSPPPPVPNTWAEHLAGSLADAVHELEERPTLEVAFECLVIAREVYNTRPNGPLRLAAAELNWRICVVLARDEFRHTPDMIDQRVESILGRRLLAPIRPVGVPTVPAISHVAVAERPRPPQPIPAKTDVQVAVVPEQPAPASVPAAVSMPVPPAPPKTTPPVMIRDKDLTVAERPRPPQPVSAKTDVQVAVVPEQPALASAPAEVPMAVSAAQPKTLPPMIQDKDLTVAERPRPPQPIPAKTDVQVGVVPEQPAPASVPAAVSMPVPPAPPKTTPPVMIRDKDLMRLVRRWSTLPDHVKKCVIMLLDAADSPQNTTE